MTEESIAGMAEKMHQMERDITALSQRISASDPRDQRSGDQETEVGPLCRLERGDCEKGLAELLSRLESISAEMVRSSTTEQLKRDGESLRKDLDAQLEAELTLVQRIESMEQTIQWLSDHSANGNTVKVDSQCEIIAQAKEGPPNPDEAAAIIPTIECKETRKTGNSNFPSADSASSRARRRSSGDVKKDSFGPFPQRPRSKSIGRLPVSKEPQRHHQEPMEAPPTGEQSSSPPRKEPLTNLTDQKRPKKKMLSKRRSLTNKITGLSINPLPSGDRETDPSVSAAAGQKSQKRLAAASKKALIDVDQLPKEGNLSQNAGSTTSSASSLPPSPPEGRLNKSKTFVAEKHAALKRGKVNSIDKKAFTESSEEARNDGGGSSLDAKKRDFRRRKLRMKSQTQNPPPAEDVPRSKDEKRAGECAGEISPVAMSGIGSGIGDWDCLPRVNSPTSRIDRVAKRTETDPASRRRHNLERQKRRQSKESRENPPFRRHKRISSKESSNNSSSSSSGDASTVKKKPSGSDSPSPPTCDTASEDHEQQQREGQLGHRGVVRAAMEAVARTALGAAAVAAGVGSPKSQASVDSKVPASSSSTSSPHESCNDLASDIPAGTADSAKADGKRLSRKSSKAKLAEKKQSTSSELNKSEDDENLKSRRSSEGSNDWKVTISSREDVSVKRTSSGQTVVVTPKRPEKAEMAKASAAKPRPKKGEGVSSEKVAKRQRRHDDLVPKPGQYPATRPPRDHRPAAKVNASPEKEVVPEIITSTDQVVNVPQAESAKEIRIEIRDGPAEANLMDAPEMAVTPAPIVGQIRQSPDGANSSVIDATSTCGRGSVANLDNVVDEETSEKLHQVRTLLFAQPLIIYLWNALSPTFNFI